ncbi:hypothetical protein A9Q78_04385 [Methylophaga sp. 41_12_T18]|nr:hypothetical protein A9Q78_04385 [Methylophaga sp. 41_12_T18]
MFKKLITTALLSAVMTTAYANESCMPIGGTGMPNFFSQQEGVISAVAPLSGSFSAATARVIAERQTETGLEMDMQHFFMTDKGGFMNTHDLAILTKVPGKKDRFMIEITYHVQAGSTSGQLADYTGTFNSYGLVDLENNQGVIRYSGEICQS